MGGKSEPPEGKLCGQGQGTESPALLPVHPPLDRDLSGHHLPRWSRAYLVQGDGLMPR